ncbi:MAG TPA: YdcF family protein [Rubrivivax sp.]|nr:YdcF family protein [Rubrivivax sp.]
MDPPPSLTYLLGAVIVPPSSLILLGLLGLGLRRRWPALGAALTGCSLLALLLLSLPLTGAVLMSRLEPPPLRDTAAIAQAQARAIVILGGGIAQGAPEWGGDTVNGFTLPRVRYGAWLARRTQLPVLITGAAPRRGHAGEAALMRGLLENEFGVAVRWFDDRARTTAGNAREAAALLQAAGVHRIVLVTSAFHMPRAQRVFERAGLQVLAAPTAYFGWNDEPFAWTDLVPSGDALRISYIALREMAAGLMYRVVDRQ